MFVLASASKARQKLLDQIALKYKVIVSDFDETKVAELDPYLKVKLLAKSKADVALKKLKNENQGFNNFHFSTSLKYKEDELRAPLTRF